MLQVVRSLNGLDNGWLKSTKSETPVQVRYNTAHHIKTVVAKYAHKHAHTHTHTHMHAHAHAHAHAHTHTSAHTHTIYTIFVCINKINKYNIYMYIYAK